MWACERKQPGGRYRCCTTPPGQWELGPDPTDAAGYRNVRSDYAEAVVEAQQYDVHTPVTPLRLPAAQAGDGPLCSPLIVDLVGLIGLHYPQRPDGGSPLTDRTLTRHDVPTDGDGPGRQRFHSRAPDGADDVGGRERERKRDDGVHSDATDRRPGRLRRRILRGGDRRTDRLL